MTDWYVFSARHNLTATVRSKYNVCKPLTRKLVCTHVYKQVMCFGSRVFVFIEYMLVCFPDF